MKAVVDSSALLAYLYENDPHAESATTALETTYHEGKLFINSVVYAELVGEEGFADETEIDQFLDETGIDIESPLHTAMVAAGDAFTELALTSWRRCSVLGMRRADRDFVSGSVNDDLHRVSTSRRIS